MDIEVIDEKTILSGDLFYRDSEILIKHFTQLLDSATDDIQIDLGKIEAVDTAALQIIIAFIKSVEQTQKSVMFTSLSKTFKDTLEITGLDAFFVDG